MPNAILTEAIDALAARRDLNAEQASIVLEEIMRGNASEVEIAGFLIALRTKGETVEELAGLASAMRALAAPVRAEREDLLDTAGTGGGRRTFNVSTTAALIAAGAGSAVAKHGNRSATSLSGSADLLEALGARIDLDAAAVASCIDESGFGFMFAPAHHQATRFVVPVRRELAVRTIFNLLGPLTNPAGARRQVIGVSDPLFLETVAGALAWLGTERALVVSSEDGLDEISASAPTHVVEVTGGDIQRYLLAPEEAGIASAAATPDGTRELAAELRGGTPDHNAGLTRAILEGQPGAATELALINAGAAIYAAGGAASIAEGVERARQALAEGLAMRTLEEFIAASERHAPAGASA
jgi:anthranilate phosphoribosyltransferase